MDGVRPGPSHPGAQLPQPLRRAHDGRWIGGVCSGMATRWEMPVAQLRALFAAATLLGGLGLLVYAACWLVLPSDADDDSPTLLRGVASVAMLVAALAGLATLALLSAAATLFGFGWAVVVALAAFLAGALALLPSTRPAWVLLPLVAVALPAVVVAASGVRVEAQAGLVRAAPRTPAEIPRDGYRTGVGDLFVDLRGLEAPRGAIVPLKLETGFGRTVVALPTERCFDVEVRYGSTLGGWDAIRSLAQNLSAGEDPRIVLYGEQQPHSSGIWVRRSDDPRAPTLRVSFDTVGGDLFLRDYPAGVGPLYQPEWPYGSAYPGQGEMEQFEADLRGACAPGAGSAAQAERRPPTAGERRRARPDRTPRALRPVRPERTR
jgi:phage shock protein PspC (stress-responsive transcriptional regulator)